MIVNKLGSTDIELSAIGLGLWAIGGGGYSFGWGPQDDQESIDTIRRGIELGINWLDTAPVYGMGRSEKIVAEALKGIKDKVFISTKCGMCWDEENNVIFRLKKESVRQELEDSLRRLEMDVIDLYMIHKPLPEEDIEEAWETLNAVKKEGKIRYAGVSSFTLDQLKKVHAIHPVSFIEPEYHMLAREIEDGTLQFCKENNIGIFNFSTMGRGLLTGKFTQEKYEALPAEDFRRTGDPLFKDPNVFKANLELLDKLRPIAERNNRTLAHLAIAWVLRRPEIASAIVGARRPQQIEQTVPAGDWVLSPDDVKEIDGLLENHQAILAALPKAEE